MKRRMKLQSKLFRAYLFLACLILLSFAVFFYMFVSGQMIASQIEAMDTLNESFKNQVDAVLTNLDTTSANINYSNMSKNTLDNYFNLNISDSMLRDMADLFIAMSGTELKTDQINLFDFSGKVLQVGLTTLVKTADEEQMEWVEKARELGGSKIITAPYETDVYSKSTRYKQWYISLFRSFNNQYGRAVGAIETVKGCKSVFKSVISYEKKNRDSSSRIYIFDSAGNLVYPYQVTAEEKKEIERYYPVTAAVSSDEAFSSPLGHGREYAARILSSYSGYTYMTVQPQSVILQPVYNLLRILFLVVAAFLAVSAIVSNRLARTIVKPVMHLKDIIQRMEIDTLGEERAASYPVSVDELEELYQAFQNMSVNLKNSMNQLLEAREQEVKSRTQALQSQINPHFYYNTLASIMVLAENGNTDEVIQMCRNLSSIMRYITNTDSTVVTLAEEMDYVKKYLYCMKVRYQSSLNYTIDIPEALLAEKAPKLIIQPIVENAIKYGSDCAPPWHISVRGMISEDRWQIDVMDSGTGFTPEALEKISGNIRDAVSNPGLPSLKINGLGTLNVYLRWRLFCGDENSIIFSCGNTSEGHGIVSIGRYLAGALPDKEPSETK